ncbi:MAG: hypothetical protein AVDCRST_MAG66-3930, partial [uncultured Pseudonocardia sp.]
CPPPSTRRRWPPARPTARRTATAGCSVSSSGGWPNGESAVAAGTPAGRWTNRPAASTTCRGTPSSPRVRARSSPPRSAGPAARA